MHNVERVVNIIEAGLYPRGMSFEDKAKLTNVLLREWVGFPSISGFEKEAMELVDMLRLAHAEGYEKGSRNGKYGAY